MKVQTSELSGAALDWAVAKAEGYIEDVYSWLYEATVATVADSDGWRPSTKWGQGGPIIEREGIGFYKANGSKWWAHPYGGDYNAEGQTALITAMRCYVTYKLGAEVEVPEGD